MRKKNVAIVISRYDISQLVSIYKINLHFFFYCVFQYLKLKTAKISNISQYCPIDLFSNKADRMNRAIKGLIENPQNNLKMFQDGKMVYNEYSHDKSSLKRIMKSLFPDVKSVDK